MSSVLQPADDEEATVNIRMLQQIASHMDGWTDRMCKRVDELLRSYAQSDEKIETAPLKQTAKVIAITA